ncbi:hypothetical protein ACDT17_07520 [Chromobacterium piscinae]|nr:hypothetical protein [Chromobacterium vaccinii]NHQ84117.1 hypothetical protein [Chromobacterium vaccinii]
MVLKMAGKACGCRRCDFLLKKIKWKIIVKHMVGYFSVKTSMFSQKTC